MLAVQPLSLGGADEKLGTVCVGSSVGHGQDARPCVLQDEVLVIKLLPVDGLAASAIVTREVPTLAHKSRDNPVKAGTFVTESLLSSTQSTKVLCCLWNFVCKQLERDAAQRLAVHGDVKEHGGVDHGWTATATPGRRRL
uniref:Peptidylprolyl isomerase A n=1 Tax=Canis lupus familiaris TaxID=9615 RepID=A0A8I3PCL9_CANLF